MFPSIEAANDRMICGLRTTMHRVPRSACQHDDGGKAAVILSATTRQWGLTLTETLAAMAVVAVGAGLAAPTLGPTGGCTGVRSATEDLRASLALARAEALRRGTRVVICHRPPNSICDPATGAGCRCDAIGNDWSSGWLVYVEGELDLSETSPRIDPGEQVLAVGPDMLGMSVTGNSSVARYIAYTATGRAQTHSGAFQAGTLCITHQQHHYRHALVLNAAGRVSLLRPDAGDVSSSCPSLHPAARACL